jgi:predicted transcriptional regulator
VSFNEFKKMVQRKMGGHWVSKKRGQISTVWKKVCEWVKEKVSKVRAFIKSNVHDKIRKGERSKEKAPSPKHWP